MEHGEAWEAIELNSKPKRTMITNPLITHLSLYSLEFSREFLNPCEGMLDAWRILAKNYHKFLKIFFNYFKA